MVTSWLFEWMQTPSGHSAGLYGLRYYDRSDCGIYCAGTWYTSICMHSERTIGFEFTNGESTLTDFSADRALQFMQHGRKCDNIFCLLELEDSSGNDDAPLKTNDSSEAKKNRSGHVRGVISGDVLCTTMEAERDGLYALKVSFFQGFRRGYRHPLGRFSNYADNHILGPDAFCRSRNRLRDIRNLGWPAVGAPRRQGLCVAGRSSRHGRYGCPEGNMGSD